MAINEVLARNVRALMEHHHLNQPALARLAGTDQKAISRLIHATNSVSIDKLPGLAKAFDLEPCQLLMQDLDPTTAKKLLCVTDPMETEILRLLRQRSATVDGC